MTEQEIQELARHRKVPSWVIKLVADAVAAEREACAAACEAQRNIEWVRANIPCITHDPANTMANKCAAAIRARGIMREHVMSGDCWCNPELNYIDPETGAEVWVHKEPQ